MLRTEKLVRVCLADDGCHPQVTLTHHAVHILGIGLQTSLVCTTYKDLPLSRADIHKTLTTYALIQHLCKSNTVGEQPCKPLPFGED